MTWVTRVTKVTGVTWVSRVTEVTVVTWVTKVTGVTCLEVDCDDWSAYKESTVR